MSNVTSKTLTGVKYVYLLFFFALLAGFFHPLITDTSFDSVTIGILVSFVGLGGAVLLYKAGTSEKRRGIYLGAGFGIMLLTVGYISQIAGRPFF